MTRYTVGRFATVDMNNPDFWRLFERFTFDMIRRGFQHYSARAVFDRVRWETATPLDDGSGFKIGNDWSPWYARKFHLLHPAHDGFFRTRIAEADVLLLPKNDPVLWDHAHN